MLLNSNFYRPTSLSYVFNAIGGGHAVDSSTVYNLARNIDGRKNLCNFSYRFEDCFNFLSLEYFGHRVGDLGNEWEICSGYEISWAI